VNFVLVFDENNDLNLYKNILYEDNGSLKEKFDLYNKSKGLLFINVEVKKQYLVINSDYDNLNILVKSAKADSTGISMDILEQFDYFYEAENYIEECIIDNKIALPKDEIYFIIDMNYIVVCFENVKWKDCQMMKIVVINIIPINFGELSLIHISTSIKKTYNIISFSHFK